MEKKAYKIAIVGPPSTGKTTLAYEVTHKLKKMGKVATFCPEYVRRWMSKHDTVPSIVLDQFAILRGQLDLENDLAKTQDIVVTDVAAWLGPVYASMLVGKDPTKNEMSDWYHVTDLIEKSLKNKYDLVFLLPRVFKLQEEAGRVQTEEAQVDLIDRKIRAFITLFNMDVIELAPENLEGWSDFIISEIVRHLYLDSEEYMECQIKGYKEAGVWSEDNEAEHENKES